MLKQVIIRGVCEEKFFGRLHVVRVLRNWEEDETKRDHDNFDDSAKVSQQVDGAVDLALVLSALRGEHHDRLCKQVLVFLVDLDERPIELLADVVEIAFV